jgi:hypothetical protein
VNFFSISKLFFRGGAENVQQIKKKGNRRRAQKVLTNQTKKENGRF